MEIKSKIDKGKLTIYLKGELDEYSAQKVRVTIDNILAKEQNVNGVVFDFSKTSFMDSTGIGVLIGRYKILKKRDIPSFILNPSLAVNKIFQLSGIYSIIPKI